MYAGKVLKVVTKTNTLELGELVYCFVDEGFQFRVSAQRDINGVREVIFDNADRHKFEVYQ